MTWVLSAGESGNSSDVRVASEALGWVGRGWTGEGGEGGEGRDGEGAAFSWHRAESDCAC